MCDHFTFSGLLSKFCVGRFCSSHFKWDSRVVGWFRCAGGWVEKASLKYKCSWSLRTASGGSQVKRRCSLTSNPHCQETEPVSSPPPIRTLVHSSAQGYQNRWVDHVFALFCEECNRCSLGPRGDSLLVIIRVVLLCRGTWTAPGSQHMCRQTERRGRGRQLVIVEVTARDTWDTSLGASGSKCWPQGVRIVHNRGFRCIF